MRRPPGVQSVTATDAQGADNNGAVAESSASRQPQLAIVRFITRCLRYACLNALTMGTEAA